MVAVVLVAGGTLITVAVDEVLLPVNQHAIPTGYLLAGAYGIATAALGQRTLAAYERFAPPSRHVVLEIATICVAGLLLGGARALTGPVPGVMAALAFGGLGLLAAEVIPSVAEMTVATFAVLFLFLLGGTGGAVVAEVAMRADVSVALTVAFLACRYGHLAVHRARLGGARRRHAEHLVRRPTP